MRWKPRLCTWIKWACTAGSVVGVGAIVFSAFFGVLWMDRQQEDYFAFERGGVYLNVSRDRGGMALSHMQGWHVQRDSKYGIGDGRPWLWRPDLTVAKTWWEIDLPLWLPTACTGVGALLLWKPWRRRARDGVYCECGYDLRGLSSGAACPECGAAFDFTASGASPCRRSPRP